MKEPFNQDGCLTDLALHTLLHDNPEELTRLEIAEHLSFCDYCTERYADLLCESSLLAPPQPLAEEVLHRIAHQAQILFFNRYVAAGMAACFTMTFWFAGVFKPHHERFDNRGFEKAYAISESFTGKAQELSENFFDNFQVFLNQLSDFDLKGVLQYEKK